MSTTVSIDGTNYEIPENGERGWGTEVSNALIALSNNSLLIKGGSIPLTSEADFGANFGHKTIYYKTATADPSSTGVLRLSNTDSVSWRNGANDGDLDLTISADRLQYEAVDLVTLSSTDTLTNKTITSAVLNTQVTGDALETDLSASALSTKLATAASIKTYVDNQISANDDASEITYTPTTPGDWPDPDPTTVQGGLDDIAEDFTDHAAATAAHGIAGAVVGTTDAQTLTNKTLTSPSITTPTGIVKGDVGLSNVDNTSDANKPVSTATQTALDAKADETITITGTGALGGGGDLTANRTITMDDNATFPGLGGVVVPASTTANRGASTTGRLRFNTDSSAFEGYDGTSWASIGGGGGLVPSPQTTSFNAVSGKFYLIDTSGGDVTVTLPNIASQEESIGIQVTDATNSVIVNADASDTVDSATTFTLRNKNDWRVLNAESATNWYSYRASNGNGAIVTGFDDEVTLTSLFHGDSGDPGLGSVATNYFKWQRVGTEMYAVFSFAQTSSGSNGSGTYYLDLPAGLTLDATVISDTQDAAPIGSYQSTNINGQTLAYQGIIYEQTTGKIRFREQTGSVGSTQAWSSGSAGAFSGALKFGGWIRVPIAEWANTGTTVTLSDLTARTKCVDDSVLGIVAASSGLSTPVTGVTKVTAFAYRDSAGCYRINYNGAFTTASAGSARFRFGGTTFDTTLTSPVIANTPSGAAGSGNVEPGTNNIVLAGATGTTWQSSGDVLLDGKPSWFDANVENSQSIDAQVLEGTETVAGIFKANRTRTKTTAATTSTGFRTDLTFSGLTVGKLYRVDFNGNSQGVVGTTNNQSGIDIYNANETASNLITSVLTKNAQNGADGNWADWSTNMNATKVFTAVSTHCSISFSNLTNVQMNASSMTVTELNNTVTSTTL